jgi:hypothetical protein
MIERRPPVLAEINVAQMRHRLDHPGMTGFRLEMLGQLGILLVIIGLIRARLIRVWPLLMVVVGIIVNLAGGIMLTTLLAGILLLATGCWIAVALARCNHQAWLGMPTEPAAA